MNLRERIELLERWAAYMQSDDQSWREAKETARQYNPWFIPDFIEHALHNIIHHYLQPDKLTAWLANYPTEGPASEHPKRVGVVMAGNIPLVGFHDFLCVFLSGHHLVIKPSTKDNILLPHLIGKLLEWAPSLAPTLSFSERLKECDAYIATGSNNSSRYFEYYFGKYPSIIRRNRTSVAVLTGKETPGDLDRLADDVQLYFGLGCRNVTKLYVPEGYDFVPVLEALRKYQYFFDHSKYRNNYDYQLAIYIMNNQYYMTNESVVLLANKSLFSPIGTLYYEYYKYDAVPSLDLAENQDIQCLIGEGGLPFGQAQSPGLNDYADRVDTMAFLTGL